MHAWAGGYFERFLVTYYADYYMQLTGISDLGDRVTQFSTFLTASNPYLRFSVDLSKSFADVFNLSGWGGEFIAEVAPQGEELIITKQRVTKGDFDPVVDEKNDAWIRWNKQRDRELDESERFQ